MTSLPGGRRPTNGLVVTLGVFDGVHTGHQFLIQTAQTVARDIGASARVLTFDPHPAMILAPGRLEHLLTPLEEKLRRIRALGIDDIGVVPFDRPLSLLEPEEFIARIVDPEGMLVHLVIGHDFALGRNRTGDAARLTTIGVDRGFQVSRVPALRVDGDVVSSTRVRLALAAGDIPRVIRLLGRPYALCGLVRPGDGRGRTIGFPTANLRLPADKSPPPIGVYAVRVSGVLAGGRALRGHPAVMNFGRRPTFGGGEPVAEVHLLDLTVALDGEELEVEILARLREEIRFPDLESLVIQIRDDVGAARRVLGVAAPAQGPEGSLE